MAMEQVILVNEQDQELGLMEKMEAHERALLHRAFSVFVFNNQHELLVQQRALSKYHSGGLWTNTCCSHPRAGETIPEAAHRRLKEEMGFDTELEKAFDFIYKAELDNQLTEYEFDHVLVGQYDGIINPAPEEVMDYTFLSLDEISLRMQQFPGTFTAWFHIAFPRIREWFILQMNKQDGEAAA
jgi:isopentenyl-diphosphate delta-isomerase